MIDTELTGRRVDDTGANARIACFLVTYFVVTSATIYATRFSGGLALVWLGTGILTGLFVHIPYKLWPRTLAYFTAASACATTLFGFGPMPAVPLALVNIGEAAAIALVLRKLCPKLDFLENYRSLAILAVAGGIAGPALAAVPGALIVVTLATGGTWLESFELWIAGHGVGTLLVLPLAMLVARGSFMRLVHAAPVRGIVELALTAIATIAVTVLSLLEVELPTLFLPVVPLIAACLLFGWLGAAVVLLCIVVTSSTMLAMGAGHVSGIEGGMTVQALFLQFYFVVLMFLALPVSAVLARNRSLLANITKRDALHRLITDHSDDAMLTVGLDGRIHFASHAACALAGEEALQGRKLTELALVRDLKGLRRTFLLAADAPGETMIHEHPFGDYEDRIYIETKVCAYPDEDGKPAGFVVAARDVTRRRERELAHEKVEQTDPLTGLPNRRKFFKRLKDVSAHAGDRPCSLAVFDIDDFAAINRRYGRDVGDLILRHIGKTLRLRGGDELFFARLSGEEFGLIATGYDTREAEALCWGVAEEIGHRDATASRATPPVAVSFGVVELRADEAAPDAMRRLDDRLMQVKTQVARKVRRRA